jgi:hypothetical protein
MGRITYFLLATIILNTTGFAQDLAKDEKTEYEEDIRIPSAECLQLFESHRGFGGNHELRFYNTCPQNVWASVCIEERAGKFKKHESASKIPKYGYWNIYTYETSAPVSVNWRSGPAKQPPPGSCGQGEQN